MNKEHKTRVKSSFMLVTYGILLYLGLQNFSLIKKAFVWLFAILQPVAYGICIAFVINLFLNLFQNKIFRGMSNSKHQLERKLAPVLSAVCTVLVGLILVAAVIFLIIPQITTAINMLIEKMPDSQEQVLAMVEAKLTSWNAPPFLMEKLREIDINWDTAYDYVINFLDGKIEITSVLGTAFSATASVLSTVTNLLLGLIIAVYLLLQKERVLFLLHKLIQLISPKRYHDRVFRILHLANISFSNFLTGQFIEAIIIGSLCAIGLSAFRFPYAATIGILTGITALLPIIGAWIGGGIGALLILVECPEKTIWFLVFIFALQQLEGQLIYPRVVGTSIGLPGLLVLIAVILGGGFGGIPGILFAVPVCAILYQLLKEAIDNMDEEEPQTEAETASTPVNRSPHLPAMESLAEGTTAEIPEAVSDRLSESAAEPAEPEPPAKPAPNPAAVQKPNSSGRRKKKKRR
ncbi:MAG: AI-2E family transporter [Oscillospiraceae bacterium]|nr:AI-2E family transporter [Oscillospiraceae bacterium]